MQSLGGILRMIGPIATAIAPATGPFAPFVGAAGMGATLGGGLQGALQPQQGLTLPPPPAKPIGTTAFGGGGSDIPSPGAGLSTFNIPTTSPGPGPASAAGAGVSGQMGYDIANNLLGPQNPFAQYAMAA